MKTQSGSHTQTDSSLKGDLLILNLAVILLFSCLQIWRPYYFLTDDNLTFFYVMVVKFGKDLLAGHNPFFIDGLFAEKYNTLLDPGYLWLRNPICVALSLLAPTRLSTAILEIYALCQFFLMANGMYVLARHFDLNNKCFADSFCKIFLACSYAFSGYNLVVGTSWAQYLATAAALPWLGAGLLAAQRTVGVWTMALSWSYLFLCGHPHSIPFSLLFFGVFVGLLSLEVNLNFARRAAISLGAAALVCAPFLVPAMIGFTLTPRAAGVSAFEQTLNSMPIVVGIFSPIFGSFTARIETFRVFSTSVEQSLFIGSFAASWLFFCKSSWQIRPNVVGKAALTTALLVLCFTARPPFLADIVSYVPVLRALRWPFKETLFVTFFLHFFLVSTLAQKRGSTALPLLCGGLGCMLLQIRLLTPPTFNQMTQDRKVILSGQADRYWQKLNQSIPRDALIAAVIPERFLQPQPYLRIPFSLLGGYNYALLFDRKLVSGYSTFAVPSDASRAIVTNHYSGSFGENSIDHIKDRFPLAYFFELKSVDPVTVRIVGPGIDRTFTPILEQLD